MLEGLGMLWGLRKGMGLRSYGYTYVTIYLQVLITRLQLLITPIKVHI